MTPRPFTRWLGRLFEPVDIAALVYYRIAFGALMVWNLWFYYRRGFIALFWIDPTFRFSFPGFGWVQPWPGSGIYYHCLVLGVLAALITVGCLYRLSAALFFLGYAYLFMLDQANYRNHSYLICLISFLMIFVPAHRAFSVDAWWRPALRSDTAPAWTLWMLRAQMGIVYFFGGLAKLTSDWFYGEPMRSYLVSRTDVPIIGPLLASDSAPYVFSYGGFLFDLLVVPCLLWRRTRLAAFLVVVGFHLTNMQLFDIGVFPWFSIATTALFFPPDWPRRFISWFTSAPPVGARAGAAKPEAPPGTSGLGTGQKVTVALLAVGLVVQVLVPLRRHLYPGNFLWTEEGYLFSWDMIVSTKSGTAKFEVKDRASGNTWVVDPGDYLTVPQERMMMRRPSLILDFSHFLASEWRKQGYEEVEVRARSRISLNNRTPQWLVDPEVDLAAQRPTLGHSPWITTLREPVPPVAKRAMP
jgi:vitamin K-dependent gamma-carboxylase